MDFDETANEMVCMLCFCRLKSLKVDTIKKHHDRKHAGLNKKEYSDSKKKLLALKYDTEMKMQQTQMTKLTDPQQNITLASNRLAFVIGKHKKPLADCEHYLEFARCTDPESDVFKQMACSRRTITRRMVEIHAF
jgi:hypothetical protein